MITLCKSVSATSQGFHRSPRAIASTALLPEESLPPWPPLPTYSPNLNLIERVWKFVKKKALANRHFADIRSFQNAINDVLDGLDTTFQARRPRCPRTTSKR